MVLPTAHQPYAVYNSNKKTILEYSNIYLCCIIVFSIDETKGLYNRNVCQRKSPKTLRYRAFSLLDNTTLRGEYASSAMWASR